MDRIREVARECASLALCAGESSQPGSASFQDLHNRLGRKPTEGERKEFIQCFKECFGTGEVK